METETETQQELNRFYRMLKWVIVIGFAILIGILLRKCKGEPSVATQKVTTKEVKGSFKPTEPKNTVIENNYYVNGKKQPASNDKFLQEQIDKLLVENQKLVELFSEKPAAEKDSVYKEAIKLNEFSQTFDDEKVKIDVSGIAQGKVKVIKADYFIKPQKIDVEVKQKQRVFALKLGAEYGNSIELNKGVFKGNIEFENKKGNSFSYSYDSDKRHWLGCKMTIFDIKR